MARLGKEMNERLDDLRLQHNAANQARYISVLLSCAYTMQPVVQPVVQWVILCKHHCRLCDAAIAV